MNLPDPPRKWDDIIDEQKAKASERMVEAENRRRRSGAISMALVVLAAIGGIYWYNAGDNATPTRVYSTPVAAQTHDSQLEADVLVQEIGATVTTLPPSQGVPIVQSMIAKEQANGCAADYGIQFMNKPQPSDKLRNELDAAQQSVMDKGGAFTAESFRMTQPDAPPFVMVVAAVKCAGDS